jgi:hypothetical protein
MQSWHEADHSRPADAEGSKKGTPHNLKTAAMRDFLEKNPTPTAGEAIDKTKEAYRDNDPRIKAVQPKEKQDAALNCMELILMAYLKAVHEPVPVEGGEPRKPTDAEIRATPLRGASY